MQPKRFVSIWFPYLKTNWFLKRNPLLKETAFVLFTNAHGRMVISAANIFAEEQGVRNGDVLADAKAILPGLQYFDEQPGLPGKLLKGIAEWCIRFSPTISVDEPDGLIIDATGCTHLWGGEEKYITEIHKRLSGFGYDTRLALADTIGSAWAISRFVKGNVVIAPGQQVLQLVGLPSAALRLESDQVELLEKLGLRQIGDLIPIPRHSLARRFGRRLITRLNQAIGLEEEFIQAVLPTVQYQERLPCFEPIVTDTGVRIGLELLLAVLCDRLKLEEKGIRKAVFKGFRSDGKVELINIGTNRPTHNKIHLFKLFEINIPGFEPATGIELFILEAISVEPLCPTQESMWMDENNTDDVATAELIDRLSIKLGEDHVQYFLPAAHHWPEHSFKLTSSFDEPIQTTWHITRPRPIQVLAVPIEIEVMAPIPAYPPMQFRYEGILHKIIKADGPERIEQEWWLQEGRHRDYYYVEDEKGRRYWLFRSGHYDAQRTYKWFLHGFFA